MHLILRVVHYWDGAEQHFRPSQASAACEALDQAAFVAARHWSTYVAVYLQPLPRRPRRQVVVKRLDEPAVEEIHPAYYQTRVTVSCVREDVVFAGIDTKAERNAALREGLRLAREQATVPFRSWLKECPRPGEWLTVISAEAWPLEDDNERDDDPTDWWKRD